MKKMLAIAGLAFIVASCNPNYEKTPSGLTYKIIKGDNKQKLKFGDIVKINGSIKITPKDTFLFSTTHLPEYLPVDTSSKQTHDFNEVLKLCSVGDSLIVVAQVDTLVKRGMAQYNEMFKKGDQIVTALRIQKAFSNQADQAKDQQMEMEKERVRQVAEVENYLKKKGIKAEKTQNGVFVEVLSPGSAEKITPGKEVTVNYTGAIMETGKVFDSNTDSTFHHLEPLKFVVGAGRTIRGWEEGMQLLGNGGKGNIYIPSLLGYGPPGSPPAIPPYSNLKFAVEVKNVVMAPPPPPMQGMPGGMQGQGQQDPRQQQQSGGN
ncbi:MAG TPA: FKBP-type peptidyl-prolyl cis-trans isomerase [Segetibacter sp.]